jgi:hypothetical protein
MPEYLVASFARSAVRLALGAQIEILASAESAVPVRKVRMQSRYLPPPDDALTVGLDLRVWGAEEEMLSRPIATCASRMGSCRYSALPETRRLSR